MKYDWRKRLYERLPNAQIFGLTFALVTAGLGMARGVVNLPLIGVMILFSCVALVGRILLSDSRNSDPPQSTQQ